MTIGEKTKCVRAKLKLTQKELSRLTGIPQNTIIKWETNKTIKPQMINYGKFIDFCDKNGILF